MKSESTYTETKKSTEASSVLSVASDEEKLLREREGTTNQSADSLSFPTFQWVSSVSKTMHDTWQSLFEDNGQVGKTRSEEIDRYLLEESRAQQRRLIVTMLGDTAQKEFLWKQMRLITNPLSLQERLELAHEAKRVVIEMVHHASCMLAERMESKTKGKEVHADEITDPSRRSIHQFIRTRFENTDEDTETRIGQILEMSQNEELVAKFSLGENAFIQEWEGYEIFGCDTATLMNCPCPSDKNILRIAQRVLVSDYEPIDHDYLHFDRRLSPWMIRETTFEKGRFSIRFQDPVRNCGERRKWIHHVEVCHCVLFIADIGQYDEYLWEDHSASRLKEQTTLFDSVAHSSRFKEAPILLILANVSVFKSKLPQSPLSNHFPDYKGEDVDDAIKYISDMFLEASQERKNIQSITMDATREQDVQDMVDSMEWTVLKEVLEKIPGPDSRA